MPRRPERAITITLSPAQVDQVVRAAAQSRAPGISALVGGALRRTAPRPRGAGDPAPAGYTPSVEDRRLSRSLLRGLSILTCFGPDDEERGILELAREAGMSPSTAHRYVLTLLELGLLERTSRSRKYRLPATPPP